MIKFTEKFRVAFANRLRKNKRAFYDQCIAQADKAFGSYYRVILEAVSEDYYPFKLDLKKIKGNIIRLMDLPGPYIQHRHKYSDKSFYENEIKFEVHRTPFPQYGTKEGTHYRSECNNLEYDCESEFWEEEHNVSIYEAISNFECFINTTAPISQLNSLREKGNIVNFDGWGKYVLQLIKTFFPDFTLDEKLSSRRLRFLKPLTDSLSFGFEFDKANLNKIYKKGDIELPEYFNLILVNKEFKKGTDSKLYAQQYNEDIMSLGILGNPLFFEPCYPLGAFMGIENIYIRNQPGSYNFKYKREYKEVDQGSFQIIHSPIYGEKIKRHAFFYMTCLSFSTKSYLDYLALSIEEALTELT